MLGDSLSRRTLLGPLPGLHHNLERLVCVLGRLVCLRLFGGLKEALVLFRSSGLTPGIGGRLLTLWFDSRDLVLMRL